MTGSGRPAGGHTAEDGGEGGNQEEGEEEEDDEDDDDDDEEEEDDDEDDDGSSEGAEEERLAFTPGVIQMQSLSILTKRRILFTAVSGRHRWCDC